MRIASYLSFEMQRMFWEDPVLKAIEERNIVKLTHLGQMGVFFENIPGIIRIFYITIFFWCRPRNETYLLAILRTKNIQVIEALPFHFDPNTYLGIPSEEGKQDYKSYLTKKLGETLLDEAQSHHHLNLIPEDARIGALKDLLGSMLNSEHHVKRLQTMGGTEFSSPLLATLLLTGRFPLIDTLGFAFDANSHIAIQRHGGPLAYRNYCHHLNNKIRTSSVEASRHYLSCLPPGEPSPLEGLLNQQLASLQPSCAELRRLHTLGDLNFQNWVLARVLETENVALIDGLSLQFTPNSYEAIHQMGEAPYRAYCNYLNHKIRISDSETSRHYLSYLPPGEPSPLEGLLNQQLTSPNPNFGELKRLYTVGDTRFQNTVLMRVLATGNVALIDGMSIQFVPNSHEAIHQMGEASYRAYCSYLLEKMYTNLSSPPHFHNYMSLFPQNEPSPLETLFDRIVQEHEPAAKLLQLSQLGGAAFAATFMLKALQTRNEDLLDSLYQFGPDSYVYIYQNWAALEGENGYMLYVQYLIVKMLQNEDNSELFQKYLDCFLEQEDPNMPGVITQTRAKQLLLELKLAPLKEALDNQVEIDLNEWPHNEVYEVCEKAQNFALYNSYCNPLIENLYQNLLNPRQFKDFLGLFPQQDPRLMVTQNAAFERLRDLILTKESRVEDLENFYVLLGDQRLLNHSLSHYMGSLYDEDKTTITDEEKDLIDCIMENEDFSDPQWVDIKALIGRLPDTIKPAFTAVFNQCLGKYYQSVTPPS